MSEQTKPSNMRFSAREVIALWNSVEPGPGSWELLIDTFLPHLERMRAARWEGWTTEQKREAVDKYLQSKRSGWRLHEDKFLRVHERPRKNRFRDSNGKALHIGNMFDQLKNLSEREINAILREKAKAVPYRERDRLIRKYRAILRENGVVIGSEA